MLQMCQTLFLVEARPGSVKYVRSASNEEISLWARKIDMRGNTCIAQKQCSFVERSPCQDKIDGLSRSPFAGAVDVSMQRFRESSRCMSNGMSSKSDRNTIERLFV